MFHKHGTTNHGNKQYKKTIFRPSCLTLLITYSKIEISIWELWSAKLTVL